MDILNKVVKLELDIKEWMGFQHGKKEKNMHPTIAGSKAHIYFEMKYFEHTEYNK